MSIASSFTIGQIINSLVVHQLDKWINSVSIATQWNIQQSKALINAAVNLKSFV